jgi:hypothetical protein
MKDIGSRRFSFEFDDSAERLASTTRARSP